MTATVARQAFVQQQFRNAVSTTAAVQTKYGEMARKSDDPVETWFDHVSDAQTMADARQALLSGDRRRFDVGVIGLSEALALTYTGAAPLCSYIDSERAASMTAIVCSITIDFGKQQAQFGVWG